MLRLLALLLLVSPLASAQVSETFVQQAGLSFSLDAAPEVAGAGLAAREALDTAALGATVQTNVVAVSQDGLANRADILQSGLGNQFGLVIIGDENQFSLRQIGDANSFVGDIVGSGNEVSQESIQAGNGNSYTLFLDGVNGRTLTVSQIGDGNTAVQSVAPGMAPASILQRGNGLRVTIERR